MSNQRKRRVTTLKKKTTKLIVFDGIDGCGKTTHAKTLEDKLSLRGYSVKRVRDPGDTKLGENIRKLLLKDKVQISSLSETFLFLAARFQSIAEHFSSDYDFIVSERYTMSTLAYQGNLLDIEMSDVKEIIKNLPLPNPFMTFLIDVSVELSQHRLGNKKDKIEQRSIDYYKKVRQTYLDEAYQDKNTIIIDGSLSKIKVENLFWNHFKKKLQIQ